MVKGPHENLADLKKYLVRQLEISGVTVKTGTEVTKELIDAEAPDAVILAVGGLRDTLAVDGDVPVIEMDDFMSPWSPRARRMIWISSSLSMPNA